MLEHVTKEQVEGPLTPEQIRLMTVASLESGQLAQLRTEFEQHWKNLAGPVLVKPIAEAFAKGLSEFATQLSTHAPQEAMTLYLKASRALVQLAHERTAGAHLIAKAWQTFPDAQVAQAAQGLLTGTQTAPPYALYALSEVGDEAQRLNALRALACEALENGQLKEALDTYERLLLLRPEDKEALFGLTATQTLLGSAESERTRLLASLEELNERERAEALYLIATYEEQLGLSEASLEHHWEAIELGWLDSQRALEQHYRKQHDLVALEALYRRLLQVSPPTRQPHLRRKLFVLLDSELGRPEEARPLLSGASSQTSEEVTGLHEAQQQLARAQNPLELAQASEELALLLQSPNERLAIFKQAARSLSGLPEPHTPAVSRSLERLWRRTLSLSPHDGEALSWLRHYYTLTHQSERLYEVLQRSLQHASLPQERQQLASELASQAQASVLKPLLEGAKGPLADTQPLEEALAKAPSASIPRAIHAYRLLERELLSIGETSTPSNQLIETWTLLRQLYQRTERWPALSALLERWFEVESDPLRAQLLGEELLALFSTAERFPIQPLALRTSQRLLKRTPQHDALALALEEKLSHLSAWEALAELHEFRLDTELTPEERLRILKALTELYLDQLHLPHAAISALERWRTLEPNEVEPARRLYQLYRDVNALDKALFLVEQIAPQALNTPDELRLQVGLAQLSELRGEVLKARTAWLRVLELSPGHAEAEEGMARLGYQDEALDLLLASASQRLQSVTAKAARLPIHIELAELYLCRMGDFSQALPHLQVIAESTNSVANARRLFQRTLIAQQRWEELRSSYHPANEPPRWRDYIHLLKEASKQARGPILGALNQEIGRVYDVHLDDPRGALEHYEGALREDVHLLESSRRYWQLTQEHPHLTRRAIPLEPLARQSTDAQERLSATLALGSLYRRSKDVIRAADAWGRALILAARVDSGADFTQALAHLIEDASATGRWELTKTALETALYYLTPHQNPLRIALHLALGTIARTRLLDTEEAIRHYQWVLELHPGHSTALEELEKIHFSTNDFDGLESVYRARLDAALSDTERVEALRNLARFSEDILLDPAKTAATLRELLVYQPEDSELCATLIRTYEQLEAYSELAELLELNLLHLQDSSARDAAQRRLALLWADTLKEPLSALPHLSALIDRVPIEQLGEFIALLQRFQRQPELQFDIEPPLERAYRRAQALRPLFNLLESRIKRIQEGQHELRVALLDELSLLAEGALRQPERAFEYLMRRFELAPDDPELWPELERLAQLARQFDTLAELWQKTLSTSPMLLTGERAVALRMRLGEIYHRRLLDLDAAIVELEATLSESVNADYQFHALEHLEVLYKKSADLEGFARVKLEAAGRTRSLTLKRSKSLEAASALAGALNRHEEALALLEPLWREEPTHPELSEALFSTSERLGDHRRTEGYLTEVIESLSPSLTRDELVSQRAQLRLDKLGAWEEAITDFMSLVDSPEIGKAARATLLDVARAEEASGQREDIINFLLDYYRQHNQNEGLVNTLLVASEFEDEPSARAQLLRQAAEHALPALTLDDETLQRAFTEQEDEASHAFDLLIQALWVASSDDELHTLVKRASLLGERSIDYLEALEGLGEQLLPELSQLSNLSLEEAELARTLAQREALFSIELGEVARAQKALRRELAIAEGRGLDDTLDSLERLLALGIELGSTEDQMHALSQLAKRRSTAEERAQAQLQLAQLARAQGNADAEELSLRDALYEAHSVDDQEGANRILAQLEELYIARSKLPELISLLQERAQLSFSPDERRSNLLRAVSVAQTHMGDRALATRLLESLISQEPNDRELLHQLSNLQSEQGLYPDQIQTLYRLEELALSEGQLTQAQDFLLQIARLHLDALHQPEHAHTVYAKLLENEPQHVQGREALLALEAREPALAEQIRSTLTNALKRELQQNPEGNWAHLAEIWERELSSELHLETALSLSELYLTRLERPDEGLTLLLRAYEFGDVRDSLRMTAHERLLTQLPQGSKALRLTLSEGLARVAEELSSHDSLLRLREDLTRLDQLHLDEATLVPLLRALAGLQPPEFKAAQRLAAFARTEGDQTSLALALEALTQHPQTALSNQAKLELADLLSRSEPDEDRALHLYRELLPHPEWHERALDQLIATLTQREAYEQALELLKEALSSPALEPERRHALTLRLAKLQAEALTQPEAAVATLLPLLARDYDATGIAILEDIWAQGQARAEMFRTLERAYSDVRDADKLVALYQSTLEQDDVDLQRECLAKLAQLERSELQRPDAAFSTLITLLEREEQEARQLELMDELELLAKGLGRYAELAERYEGLIARGRASTSLAKRTAHIYDRLAPDDARAAYLYSFAFEHDTTDLHSRDRLSAVLKRSQRFLELGEHLLRAALSLDGETLEAESERYRLRLEAAQAFTSAPLAESRALQVLDELLREVPPEHPLHTEAYALAEQVWLKLQDREGLHRLLRRWASQAADQATHHDVKVRLGLSLLEHPEEARAGITELEEVLRDEPAHAKAQEALWSFLGKEPFPVDESYIQAGSDAARLLEELYGQSFSPDLQRLLLLSQLRAQSPGRERFETLEQLTKLELELGLNLEAFEHLGEALSLEPSSFELEAELERLAPLLSRWEALADLYEQLSANESEELAAHYALKVAHLSEHHLHLPEIATRWYEQHLVAIPGSREALEPLSTLYRKLGDAASEARILQAWLDYSATPSELSELRLRLGILRMDQLNDNAGALDALEGCLPDGAADPEILRRLERLYVQGSYFKALTDLYDLARQHASTQRETLELFAKSAQIYETRLNDLTSAREVVREMLLLDPRHRFALTSLERIERARQDWEALEDVLRLRFEAASDDEQRLKHLLDRATLANLERERPEEALVHLQAADALVGEGPGSEALLNAWQPLLRSAPSIRAAAAHALAGRYRAREQWPQLINVLLLEIIAHSDQAHRNALTHELDTLLSTHGPAPAVALRVLISGLRQAPQVAALREASYQRALALGELPSLLSAADEVLRKGLSPEDLVPFAMWLGPIERQMGQLERALNIFERVLEVEPGHPEAGRILGDLYRERRDWSALRGLYHQRLSAASDAERPLLHLELALLLSETEGPEATHKALLSLLSGPEGESLLPALRDRLGDLSSGTAASKALEAHFKQRERWDLLKDLHLSRAELSTDLSERANRYALAAELAHHKLQDPESALELSTRAALSLPHNPNLWEQVEAASLAQGRPEHLRDALKTALQLVDTETQAALTLRLLPLERAAGSSLEELQALLVQARQLNPEHLGLQFALLNLLEEQQDLAGFAELLEMIARHPSLTSTQLRPHWLTLRKLAEEQQDLAHLIIAGEAILAFDPHDTESAQHLMATYRQYERWEELAELLVALASFTQDDAHAAQLWTQIAELRAHPSLADADGALAAWREVWLRDHRSQAAVTALSVQLEARQDWVGLSDLLEDHARALEIEAPELAASVWMRLGQLREKQLHQLDGAIEAYLQVRELLPGETVALGALVPLFGRTQRFRELAETLAERAKLLTQDLVEATKARLSAASVYLDHLNSPSLARALVQELLDTQPEHLEGRVLLSRIFVHEHDYEDAATILTQLVAEAEGRRKLQLTLDLARLELHQLEQVDKASDLLEAAQSLDAQLFDGSPAAKALRQRTSKLAREAFKKAKRYALLEQTLQSELGILTASHEQGQIALELARLYHTELPNLGKREQYVAIARHLAPDSLDLLRLECDIARQNQEYAQSEQLLEALIARLDNQVGHDELVRAWHSLGQVRLELSNLDSALEAFKRAHALDGKDVPNLLDYSKALVKRRRLDEAIDVHRGLMLLRSALPEEERPGVLERLAWSSWEQGQREAARTYLNRLLSEHPDHAGALDLKRRFNS